MYFFFKRGGGATRPIGSVSTFRFSRFVLILQKSHWNCTSSHEKHIMGWYDFLVSCSFFHTASSIKTIAPEWSAAKQSAPCAPCAPRVSVIVFFAFTSSKGKIKGWHLEGINNKYTSMHTFQKSWHQPPGLLASTSGVFYVGCFNPLLEKHEIDTSPENKSLAQFLGKSWWISMVFFSKKPQKTSTKKTSRKKVPLGFHHRVGTIQSHGIHRQRLILVGSGQPWWLVGWLDSTVLRDLLGWKDRVVVAHIGLFVGAIGWETSNHVNIIYHIISNKWSLGG